MKQAYKMKQAKQNGITAQPEIEGMKIIPLPFELSEMLRRNADAIQRLTVENNLLLTGFLTGHGGLNKEKKYVPNADYSAITELDNE